MKLSELRYNIPKHFFDKKCECSEITIRGETFCYGDHECPGMGYGVDVFLWGLFLGPIIAGIVGAFGATTHTKLLVMLSTMGVGTLIAFIAKCGAEKS